ncbi:hypothetical protein MY04_4631 [Flammeovirga sp. MY04]|nr:hypothetical protein [Flammeovirga sp. MY04]ANQ51966.1 hypothetical protein MY04_4631 [Flammeovirga sp. MY04]
MLQKYGDWIVRDDYFEWSFGDTGNFIWRSGDSTQKGGEFEIRKFDVK